MRIDWIKIPNDRNLRNFEIDFDEKIPITVLLGPNGSGKSNLFEDCVEIFLALERGEPVERFQYEIQYFCHGHKIRAKGSPEAKVRLELEVDDKPVSIAAFTKMARTYLPAHIFAYYSGWNARLERLFNAPTKKYYQANLKRKGDGAARRFFFCRKDYANLALLALFFEKHELAKSIREDLLGIVSFESALFVLKAPWWDRSRARTKKGGHEMDFWGARGDFTEFMERLQEAALAPIVNMESIEADVRGRSIETERLYLYIRNRERLEKLRAPYESTKLLFNHLESMYLSDLIEEIRVVGTRADGSRVRFDQLSEGEQQLVTVFGLMLFTRTDESLYLLDEPDSHLNPQWTYDYRDMLRRALFDGPEKFESENDPLDKDVDPAKSGNSQVLIGTHNPLMISSHPRSHVRILRSIDGVTSAEPPEDEPPGMSIDSLLTSDAFGLASALPKRTLDALTERDRLIEKKGRNKSEDKKLTRLNDELANVGLLRTFRLPEEKEFIEAMRRREKRSTAGMSKEDIRVRNNRADKVLEEIFSKKK